MLERTGSSEATSDFAHPTGLKQDHSARVVLAGHAFVQNLRRGHYELAIDEPVSLRLAVAFEELAVAI
jgi:hypothetical protein